MVKPSSTARPRRAIRAVGGSVVVLAAFLATPAPAGPPQAVADEIAYDAFLLGAPPSASTRQRIEVLFTSGGGAIAATQAAALHRFVSSPHGTGLDQAVTRERLWARIMARLPKADGTARRETAILLADPAVVAAGRGAVVTRSSVASIIASNDAVARLAGAPGYGPADAQALATSLRGRWDSLSASDREAAAKGASRWAALNRALATPKLRAAVARDAHAQVQARDQAPTLARTEESAAERLTTQARNGARGLRNGPANAIVGSSFLAAVYRNR